jgi:ABC-2 type transport system ATP-binding protein
VSFVRRRPGNEYEDKQGSARRRTEMNIIEVQELSRNFGQLVAVDKVSFCVVEGEIFGFLGPNGAGKTTTINMLCTLLKPTRGKATLCGLDIVKQRSEVRRCIGLVFQDPTLDEYLTAEQNLRFHAYAYRVPGEVREKRISELLELVELSDRRKNKVRTFSGGMKRRLEIARGLLHSPRVLFLDEPTLGLDPQTRSHIWGHIKSLNAEEKMTVFFTTHYMDEAERIAQRIAIIDHGKIITQGSPAELKQSTRTTSLEDAFLALTGMTIREEEGNALDRMRMRRKIFRR